GDDSRRFEGTIFLNLGICQLPVLKKPYPEYQSSNHMKREAGLQKQLRGKATPKSTSRRRRSQGRPSPSAAVGQKGLIAAVREGLKTTPPGELTFLQISKLAGADQRLIRYYYKELPDLLQATAVEVAHELRARFAVAHRQGGSPQ